MNRLIDYFVGDGSLNRYALICQSCELHNGMALKGEFEYFGFKCSYILQLFESCKTKEKPSDLQNNV